MRLLGVLPLLMLALKGDARGQRSGPRREKQIVVPISWQDRTRRFTDTDYKKRFRLDKAGFNTLVTMLQPFLAIDRRQSRNSRCGLQELCNHTVVAIAMRFLSGAQHIDLVDIYNVSHAYVYDCVYRVVDAVHSCKDLAIKFPDTVEEFANLDMGWRAKSRCKGEVWQGQIAAVDGILFSMRCPSDEDVCNGSKYYVSRKQKYAILCLATCDSNCNFLSYSMEHVPTTHDSVAFSQTKVGRFVQEGGLPAPFFVNGDSAFTNTNSMIVPTGTHGDFDHLQSSNRVAIERSFGILVRRWGVLWRPLEISFDKRSRLIGALFKLHNFCNRRRMSTQEYEDIRDGQCVEVQPDRHLVAPALSDFSTGIVLPFQERRGQHTIRETMELRNQRRSHLIEAVEHFGLKRPVRRSS